MTQLIVAGELTTCEVKRMRKWYHVTFQKEGIVVKVSPKSLEYDTPASAIDSARKHLEHMELHNAVPLFLSRLNGSSEAQDWLLKRLGRAWTSPQMRRDHLNELRAKCAEKIDGKDSGAIHPGDTISSTAPDGIVQGPLYYYRGDGVRS